MSFDYSKPPKKNSSKAEKKPAAPTEESGKSVDMPGAPDPTELVNLVDGWFSGPKGGSDNPANVGIQGRPERLPHREILESAYGTGLGQVPFYSGPDAQRATNQLNADA